MNDILSSKNPYAEVISSAISQITKSSDPQSTILHFNSNLFRDDVIHNILTSYPINNTANCNDFVNSITGMYEPSALEDTWSFKISDMQIYHNLLALATQH